jgi:uracil-DNA glycosylase
MNLREMMPESWREVLSAELSKPYVSELQNFLDQQYADETVYPPQDEIFSAFSLTPFDQVKVLVIGQDPYHGPGEAHGLSFSVKPGIKVPPSLRNIYKELVTDVGFTKPNNGYLVPWADQGVMMLNAVLTVRHKSANSHQKHGWEKLTTAAVKALGQRTEPLIVLLWGGKAKKNDRYIDKSRHHVIMSTHPSPLSARNGFFGSKPFSQINAKLAEWGKPQIDWQIPNL